MSVLEYVRDHPNSSSFEIQTGCPVSHVAYKIKDLEDRKLINNECGYYSIALYGEFILDFEFDLSRTKIEEIFSRIELDAKPVLEAVIACFWVNKKLALKDLQYMKSSPDHHAALVRNLKKRAILECVFPNAKKCPAYQMTKRGRRMFVVYGKRLEKKYQDLQDEYKNDDSNSL